MSKDKYLDVVCKGEKDEILSKLALCFGCDRLPSKIEECKNCKSVLC